MRDFLRQSYTAGINESCAELYTVFKNALAGDFTEPRGSPDLPMFCLADMCMSCTEEVVY